ncbi:hypothetical protein CWI36_2366p0010 [Hamiltosporidium magnivora]|uniref:Uncharacterized protein n=2 Tax=Hamiltosporidium magnivora TaxID=148818 RepID=A0A4Q9KUJ7_9MICR|nr:hypothetical protein CWI36_2366p0010 [Hamiltosporidium magnivora]
MWGIMMTNIICTGLGSLFIYMNREYHGSLKHIERDINMWSENKKFGMFFLYLIVFIGYFTTVIIELIRDITLYRGYRERRGGRECIRSRESRSGKYSWLVQWKFFRIINFMVVPVFVSELFYYFRQNGISIANNTFGGFSGKNMKYPDLIIIYDIIGILIIQYTYLVGKNIFILKNYLKSRNSRNIRNYNNQNSRDNKKCKKTYVFMSIIYFIGVTIHLIIFMLGFLKVVVVFSVEFNTFCLFCLTTVLYCIVFLFIEKYTVDSKIYNEINV